MKKRKSGSRRKRGFRVGQLIVVMIDNNGFRNFRGIVDERYKDFSVRVRLTNGRLGEEFSMSFYFWFATDCLKPSSDIW